MNHIYRSIWNDSTATYVAAAETAQSGGKKASSSTGSMQAGRWALKALAASLCLAYAPGAWALPQGGEVTAGSASVTTTPGKMTIVQGSQSAALNWQSFGIGAGEAVQFVQPSTSAVALNRVVGADPSGILGNLSANGKVFLVNPNGILFGKGASVSVGGLVASTLNITDSDFMAGRYKFSGNSTKAVSNLGTINAPGGHVALLGAHVSNDGVIAARMGSVSLAGGQAITLDVAGDGLLNITVDQGAVNALVSNGGLIQADGGHVLMTTQAAGQLLNTVVNNTGVIQAQTLVNHNGSIKLLSDMQTGMVNAAGTLDASAPNGGNGGFIETSAARFNITGDAKVTTLAKHGATGTWLIDPYNVTISNDAGNTGGSFSASADDSFINATTLQTVLAMTNVTVTTGTGGTQAGNITVAAPLTWSAATTLRLTAAGGIAVNAPISITGAGGLDLTATPVAGITTTGLTFGDGASVSYGGGGSIAGQSFSLNGKSYQLVHSLTQLDAIDGINAIDGTELTPSGAGSADNYVLGADLNATGITYAQPLFGTNNLGTATWFTGQLDGLGHTITGLTINAPGTLNVGLVGNLGVGGSISNTGLVGGSVTGSQFVGGLVGYSVSGTVQTSNSSAAVTGTKNTGGLVGRNSGMVQASFATGAVTGGDRTGGLVGFNTSGVDGYGFNGTGIVQNSHASGTVTGVTSTGGLVGHNAVAGTTVQASYATGAVVSAAPTTGGLIGANSAATVAMSYWDTETTGMATSKGGTGATGLTTAQLQGTAVLPPGLTFSLGTAFSGGAAGGTAGLYPYLTSAFPGGRQVVSGFAGTSSNVLVSVIGSGAPFASAVTGANGYYYASAASGTLASGDNVLAYTASSGPTGPASGATLARSSGAAVMSGVSIIPETLTSTSNATLYSQVADMLLQAEADATAAANGDPAAIAAVAAGSNRVLDTSGASFTFDQALAVNSNLDVRTSAPNAPITVAQPISVNGSSILTLNASGELRINAPVSVTGAGTLNLTAAAQPGISTTGLSFGNGAKIDYGVTDKGGSFILNGNSYRMVYSMAQLDAIDGLNAIDGTPLTVYGTGQAGNYALATDLSATGITYARSLIGTSTRNDYTSPFSGRLDGLGHAITGLTINAPTLNAVGLLSYLNGADASVSNLGLVGGSVTGGANIAGMIGWLERGTLQTSSSSAAVTSNDTNAGGLVGFNQGTLQSSSATGPVSGIFGSGGIVGWATESSVIDNSHATGAVSGEVHTGGLLGLNHGNVYNSYATGNVSGTLGNTGGLIGYNKGSGMTVSGSYATGAVTGRGTVGGLVANNAAGTIQNSYSTGAVHGDYQIGGLVGYNNATIQNSYSTGAVTGNTLLGGLIAENVGGTVARSFWNTETSGQAIGIGTDNNIQSGNVKGLTTADMKTKANFTSATLANGGVNPNWDMSTIWIQYDTFTNPLLRALMTPLTITANSVSKTYDGQAYTGNNGVTYSSTPDMNQLQGTLSYGGTSQGAIDAGSYSMTASGLSSMSQQGYLVSYFNGALTVNKADLTLGGTRVYDGTSSVAGSVLTATGVAGDTFAVTGAGDPGNLASKNVQTGSTLASVAGLALGASANNAWSGNYNDLSTTGSAISITKANLTVGAGNVSKTYDGGLTALGTAAVTSGTLFGTDAINGATFAFADKNAGTDKAVTPTGVTLADGNNGGNYNVSYATGNNGTIQKAALTASASASNKTYDGNTTAAAALTITGGLVNTETVTATGVASFNSKDVLDANLVTVNSTALADGANGGLASNYSLGSGQTAAASIVAKPLTVSGMTAANKVYDGNTAAVLSGGALSGLVGAETLALSGQSGSFADKNVGTGKAVTVTGLTLANGTGLASNYSIGNPGGLTADIAPLDSVTWVGPATGNWFSPANWAGGAMPDLSNVANVFVVPAGVQCRQFHPDRRLTDQSRQLHDEECL